MNNLLSYFGIVDARISASEKDLPVTGNQKIQLLKSLLGVVKFIYSEKATKEIFQLIFDYYAKFKSTFRQIIIAFSE